MLGCFASLLLIGFIGCCSFIAGVKGIFFDEVSSAVGHSQYYSVLAGWVKAKAPNAIVVLNPGTSFPVEFMQFADIVVPFENYDSQWPTFVPPEFMSSYAGALILSAMSMLAVLVR